MFKTQLEGCNALSVRREVRDGEKRFLCYTSFSDSECVWQIGVSDGVDVWRLSLSEQEVKGLAVAEQETNFISDISRCLESGEVELLHTVSHLTLFLRTSAQPLELNLYELSTAHRRQQLQYLVFDLWTRLNTAHNKIDQCLKELDEARQGKIEHSVLVDVSQYRTKPPSATGSRAKRPAGTSLLNPSLKRRKAVKGVVFGDSQDN